MSQPPAQPPAQPTVVAPAPQPAPTAAPLVSLIPTSTCSPADYPLGSVLFDFDLKAVGITDALPKNAFQGSLDPSCDLLLPGRDNFPLPFQQEFLSTGSLSQAMRGRDANRAVGLLQKAGILTPDCGLRLVYRAGPEQEYQLLLHFETAYECEEVRERVNKKMQLRQNAPTQTTTTQ